MVSILRRQTSTGPQPPLSLTSMSSSLTANTERSPDNTSSKPVGRNVILDRMMDTLIFHDFRVSGSLGSGQFGVVSRGKWQAERGPVDVAIKTLRDGSTEADRVRFLQEAAINGQFRHPNIVQLHGVVTVGVPVECMVLIWYTDYKL